MCRSRTRRARHLVDEGHRVAVDGKAAEGHLDAVEDEPFHRLGEAHELATDAGPVAGRRVAPGLLTARPLAARPFAVWTMGTLPPSFPPRLLFWPVGAGRPQETRKPPGSRTTLAGGPWPRWPAGETAWSRPRMQRPHPTARRRERKRRIGLPSSPASPRSSRRLRRRPSRRSRECGVDLRLWTAISRATRACRRTFLTRTSTAGSALWSRSTPTAW